jgi:hypothetical protein
MTARVTPFRAAALLLVLVAGSASLVFAQLRLPHVEGLRGAPRTVTY